MVNSDKNELFLPWVVSADSCPGISDLDAMFV